MMLKKLTTAAIAALLLLGCGGNAARSHRSQDGASAGGRYPYGDTARVSYYADYVEVRGIPQGIGELTERQMSGRRAHYRFVYGGGKLRSVTFANSAGTPLKCDHSRLIGRVSIMEFEYDDNGRLAATKMRNERGAPLVTYRWSGDDHDVIDLLGPGPGVGMVSTSMYGMFYPDIRKRWINRFKLTRDARGYVTRWEFWSDEGMADDLLGVAGFDYALDSLGRPVTLYMLGSDGQRKPDVNGVAGRSFEYDVRGNIAKVVFFGGDNRPVLNEGGWAAAVIETDAAGNNVSETFLGANGESVLDKYGTAQFKNEYDKRGYLVWQGFFGTDGNPVLIKGNFATVTVKNDDNGREIEHVYLGIDGKPILTVHGFARMVTKYDERGNITEEAFFDTDGNPIMNKDGVARLVMKYDERGNVAEQAFFDTEGNPVMNKYGAARVVMKYNERGNVTEQTFFGTDGNPVMHKDGAARIIMKYDERGNVKELAFFGTDGNPVMHADGFARMVMKCDERGNITEQAYFGVDGKPINGNEEEEEDVDCGCVDDTYKNGGAAADPASVVRDTLTDPRDGNVYRTVRIGNLTWMAENLNYRTDSSWCYDNADTNCVKYGRLYTWNVAMRACPAGWRLPSETDWIRLMHSVGGIDISQCGGIVVWEDAGTKLKAEIGWNADKEGYIPGTNEYGFSALSGGRYNNYFSVRAAGFSDVGDIGYWWTAPEGDKGPLTMEMYSDRNSVTWFWLSNRSNAFSVRCIRD